MLDRRREAAVAGASSNVVLVLENCGGQHMCSCLAFFFLHTGFVGPIAITTCAAL